MSIVNTERYYFGKPCSYGHGELRHKSNRCCVECAREAVRRYQGTERGKSVLAAYNGSPDRKEVLARYNRSEKRKKVGLKYRSSEKGAITYRKCQSTVEATLRMRLRDRVRKILKRGKGTRAGSAVRDLGCSIAQFKSNIEVQFLPGMSWDNYGQWHLDHVRPLSTFDLSIREQFLMAINYSNYQPLWAKDNLKKAASWKEA